MENKIYITAVLLIAIALRLYFYIGFVYSDDAYYSYLAHNALKGNYPGSYLGYPIFLLRVGQIFLSAAAFKIFGVSEFAFSFFPFLFSIANIILVYFFTKLITKNKTAALLSAILISFFPTDIIFASLGFPDLINAFLIYLGIFLLWRSYESKSIVQSVLSGLCFFVSMQFKENMYFFAILLFIIWIYFVYKKYDSHFLFLIPLAFVGLNIFAEGLAYLFLHRDFFYRFKIIKLNYIYSYYDFFPYNMQKYLGGKAGYWKSLFYQIFVINLKSIFLRRFYLLLPLIALLGSLINIKRKEFTTLTFLFLGITVLFLGFTTSFNSYKPLDLQRSWYIYPMIVPAVILSSIFIVKLKPVYRFGFIALYIIFSFVMCKSYETFFDKDNLSRFNYFLKAHISSIIYTDHFTGYGINLIQGYKNENHIMNFEDAGFESAKMPSGALVILNKKHVDELKLQKHKFPNFEFVSGKNFSLISTYGDYKVFEKTF